MNNLKKESYDNIIVIIPAYKPSNMLYDFIKDLLNHFVHIILIDDGSGSEYKDLFDKCILNKNVLLYKNIVNMGKGRAIKNGINFAFNKFDDIIAENKIIGFVTVDADGQHNIRDILNCCNSFTNNKDKLVLGSRFLGQDVPFRSKFGNVITSFVIKLLYGLKLKDTQTGLRVFSIANSLLFISLDGERYEFETQMLIESSRKRIQIIENDIDTIYINDNESSHFNPIIDSYKIYKVILGDFFKFSFSSFFSFFVDISFFSIFIKVFKSFSIYYVIISAVLARIISSFVNFTINKNVVFSNKDKIENTIFQYYFLAIIVLIVSSLSTYMLSRIFNGKEVFIKICVDLIIFFIDLRQH